MKLETIQSKPANAKRLFQSAESFLEASIVLRASDVTVGQPIGLSGKKGFASAPHLHFSVFQTIDGKKKLTLPFRLKTDHGVSTEFIRGRAY